MDDLDFRILKAITTDRVNALTFSHSYDRSLFSDGPINIFAKHTIDYIKTYKAPPTKNTLIQYRPNDEQVIDSVWSKLDDLEYDVKEYPFDLGKLKKRYQGRIVDEIRERAAEEDEAEDPEEFFKNLAIKMSDVARVEVGRSYIQKPVDEYIEEFQDHYVAKKENPEIIRDIKTQFSAYDALTGGISPGELIMIGGGTNSGKSMLLNNISTNIWKQSNTVDMKSGFESGYNILYFSLEMPYEDCFGRFLSNLAGVPQRGLSKATLTEDHEAKIEEAYEFIRNYRKAGFVFDIVDIPRGVTIDEVEGRYNDALLQYGKPDIVVIDYMGLMSVPALSREQDWLKMGGLAATLHEFARTYDVAVVTAAQLTDLKRSSQTKTSEEENRVGVHRWGRSSLIMHHVNVGVQIETRPGEEEMMDMPYHIVKNRKGPLGAGTLIKNFATASLIDVPYQANIEYGDISADIPNLIKQFQEKDNEENEIEDQDDQDGESEE